MSQTYLEYTLQNGYIHNWLVAGPHKTALHDLDRFPLDGRKLAIARHYYQADSGISESPVEEASFNIDGSELKWSYWRCLEDHFIDLSEFYHTFHYLRSWAYCEVYWPENEQIVVELTCNGPADLWVNDEHSGRIESFRHQIPQRQRFSISMKAGYNAILVRAEAVAERECPYVIALQLLARRDEELPVRLPSNNPNPERRAILEQAFLAAYLEHDVYQRPEPITVHWPPDFPHSVSLAIRIQRPSGAIFGESQPVAKAGASMDVIKGMQLLDGDYQIRLVPRAEEHYLANMKIDATLPLQVLRNAYSEQPYGSYESRRAEALYDATRREGSIYSEIAKMELGHWHDIKIEVIEETIASINQRADCSDFYMVGLLGMLYRYSDHERFPKQLLPALEACVLNFKYWMDEPGQDAMCYWSENHQILFHACELLAGQLFPDAHFSNAGQNGAWHKAKGERLALRWIQQRAKEGFREWDSNCYFGENVLALSHIADLAEDVNVRESAAIMLDKLFFSLAINSFKGVYGSTHGRTYTGQILGGRMEATAGIGRLLWGMGVFNEHIRGTVAQACARSYSLPPIIEKIALDRREEFWSYERHAGQLQEAYDRANGDWEINKVTYKTPDGMLCSAQDYHAGEAGVQQHIWQATLGPDAVVFVTHPVCIKQDGNHRPGFWHGNGVLPRVAQWKDSLIAHYDLPEDDWMGFTHAYFPIGRFDEYALTERWAFARRGDGYIAIGAAQGLSLVRSGPSAFRELRSYGIRNSWVCLLGRAALDGSFVDFQKAVLALPQKIEPLSVELTNLRGDELRFAWEGPFLVNGEDHPLSDYKHYDNCYCVAELGATFMEIGIDQEAMLLNFALESELAP